MIKESQLPDHTNLPLVSVCIPAYNAESTLAETLDAVLAQDYPHLDIVVSDNQSTDRTKAIVQQYAERGVRCCTPDRRPEWAVDLPGYIGAYMNANFVLSQAHGEYLCLFHSDDLYEPTIVSEQVKIMQAHPKVGAVFTRRQMIGEDSRPIQMGMSSIPDELRECATLDFPMLLNGILAHSNFLSTPSVMLRRSVIEKLGGFDERQFSTSADLEMWLRIAYRGFEIAIIDEPLLKYRMSQRQWSGQYNKLRTTLADIYVVLDHYLGLPGVSAMVQPRALAFYELDRANDQVLFCGMNLLVQGRVVEARAWLQKSLRWQDFITALRRPGLLANLVVGVGFLVSTYLGIGHWVGMQAYKIYLGRMGRRYQPIKN